MAIQEVFDVKVEATAFKTLDEVREEMEEEIESLPNRELPRHEIPHVRQSSRLTHQLTCPFSITCSYSLLILTSSVSAVEFDKYRFNPKLSGEMRWRPCCRAQTSRRCGKT